MGLYTILTSLQSPHRRVFFTPLRKIWDLWFSEGYNTFFKVAMTVFELLEGELMDKQDNDRLIDTIRTSCYRIEEAEFLRVLGKQKLFEDLKLE